MKTRKFKHKVLGALAAIALFGGVGVVAVENVMSGKDPDVRVTPTVAHVISGYPSLSSFDTCKDPEIPVTPTLAGGKDPEIPVTSG